MKPTCYHLSFDRRTRMWVMRRHRHTRPIIVEASASAAMNRLKDRIATYTRAH
jgi:hypothetical protein